MAPAAPSPTPAVGPVHAHPHAHADADADAHRVEFYETDAFLVTTVTDVLRPALAAGDAVLVVATAEHREAFAAALHAAGVDLAAAVAEDRYLTLDARQTLVRFTLAGAPDPARFAATVGGLLDRAASGGRRVHVVGEMVALLWDDRAVRATLALEELWNQLATTRRFSLLCAYPLRAFEDEATAGCFAAICGQHDAVIPAESYSLAADRDRAVAALQRENAALRADLARLHELAALPAPGGAPAVPAADGSPTAPAAPAAPAADTSPRGGTSGGGRPAPARRAHDLPLAVACDRYRTAALAGDGAGAEAIVRDAIAAAGAPRVYVEIIGEAMRQVGARWARGELGIAEEHLATAVTERVLASVFDLVLRGRPRSRSRERFVLAAVQGEQHVLGLRMAADLLEGLGCAVDFLGADVPTDALIATVERTRPTGLGLSVSGVGDAYDVHRLLRAARAVNPRMRILVGGRGAAALRLGPDVLVVDDLQRLRAAIGDPAPAGPEPVGIPSGGPAEPRSAADAPAPRDAYALLARSTAESAELVRDHARRAHLMRHAAHEDPVTGLWNRRALDDHLARIGEDAERQPIAVLVLDLDGFKRVNDEFGHEAGDALLRRVAVTIEATLRPGDFAARMGGDEFCVVLGRTDAAGGVAFAERLRAALAAGAGARPVLASIGVAEHGSASPVTLARADGAMYVAKRAGGDGVRAAVSDPAPAPRSPAG